MAFDGAFSTDGNACRNRCLAVGPGHGDGLRRAGGGDAAPVVARDHEPPCLVDLLPTHGLVPIANRPNDLAGGDVDDREHAAGAGLGEVLERDLALGELLIALGAAQELRLLGVAQRLLEERKISGPPRLESHGIPLGRRAHVRPRYRPNPLANRPRPHGPPIPPSGRYARAGLDADVGDGTKAWLEHTRGNAG